MKRVLIFLFGFALGFWASVRFTDSIDSLGEIDESSGIG